MKNFFSQCDQAECDQADLVTFTEEIVDGKLHFLCSVTIFPEKFLHRCLTVSHCTSGVTVSIETGFSATRLFVYSDC